MKGAGESDKIYGHERWYTDNFLDMSHEISKSYKPKLSLQVSVFAKMSSGVAKKKIISLIRSSGNPYQPPTFFRL